ncbi:MAG: hypothetical protein Q8R79_02485 [Legionellaceae bacterium]|nr:hypothetical protein [Legionellaceae bacterium]
MTQLVEVQCVGVTALADSIFEVRLQAEHYVPYQAGQYLQILLGEDEVSFSIAHAPQAPYYVLHIRYNEGVSSTQALFDLLRSGASFFIRVPLGHCHVGQLLPEKPVLCIAAGTGFAPVHAMLQSLLTQPSMSNIVVVWIVRNEVDFYARDALQVWEKNHPPLKVIYRLSSDYIDSAQEWLDSVETIDWAQMQVVIAGPFDMAIQLRAKVLSFGVSPHALWSDAFEIY